MESQSFAIDSSRPKLSEQLLSTLNSTSFRIAHRYEKQRLREMWERKKRRSCECVRSCASVSDCVNTRGICIGKSVRVCVVAINWVASKQEESVAIGFCVSYKSTSSLLKKNQIKYHIFIFNKIRVQTECTVPNSIQHQQQQQKI